MDSDRDYELIQLIKDPGDSDRDFKRKRDSNKEKAKSPVLDRSNILNFVSNLLLIII